MDFLSFGYFFRVGKEKGMTKELIFLIFQMSTQDLFQCVELQSDYAKNIA